MMAYKTIGNTVIEWNEHEPLSFWLSEEVGNSDARHLTTAKFDLSSLRTGFTNSFLLHLKDCLIDWRNRVTLRTLERYFEKIRLLFSNVITLKLFDKLINVIDENFLIALDLEKDKFSKDHLKTLKNSFNTTPHSPMWAQGLHASDFPLITEKKGQHGQMISRILAKAMTRATCVNILSICEKSYDLGEMDIGHFAFTNLAFAVFCRPESYRQIRLDDLVFDETTREYFLFIIPTKTRVYNPKKIAYKINEPLGVLLQKQRQHVVEQYGHLVASKNIGKLALFPARQLLKENSACHHTYARENFGMYRTSSGFAAGYPSAIKKTFQVEGCTINANVLRHTVGTQLAQFGASSRTIQAVLKHATDIVCQAYVDIAFHGLTEALSDSMQPAFDLHMPVFTQFRSKLDPVDAEQAIRSDDSRTGQIEITGECGKKIQCEFAPITCYGCVRFIPCWDADHSVNLATVELEIEDYKRRGKPFEQMVAKAQVAKYYIVMVMNASDRYRQGRTQESNP